MQYKPIHEFLCLSTNENNQSGVYIKDFDSWNEQKKLLDQENQELVFRRREIWWCKIGLNIGYEEDGKGKTFRRPVLILRKLNRFSFLGIPITTKMKEGYSYKDFFLSNGEIRVAIIAQIKMFDTKRLIKHLDTIDPSEFFPIVKAVQNLIEPLTSFVSEETASLEFLPKADTWSLYHEWVDWQQCFPQE